MFYAFLLQCYPWKLVHYITSGTGFDSWSDSWETLKNNFTISNLNPQDIEDLDHYEMKEEEPVDGKKSEDDGIEKENLAILEKIRKNQRQDHLNVSLRSAHSNMLSWGAWYFLGQNIYYWLWAGNEISSSIPNF